METNSDRLWELTTSDNLIIYSIEEFDIVSFQNKALFPDGSSPHQRGKIKSHFDCDYLKRASVFSDNVLEVTLSVEIFHTDAHKRKMAHMECMVNIDGDVYSRGEILNPKLCLPLSEIDNLARQERINSILRREKSESS